MEDKQRDPGLYSNHSSTVTLSLDLNAESRTNNQPRPMVIDLRTSSGTRMPLRAPAIMRHQRAFSYDVFTPSLERSSSIHHCSLCCENFINSHELKEHKARNCRPQYSCLTCSKSFNEITHYISHLRQHSEDGAENSPTPQTNSLSNRQGHQERSANSYSSRICRDNLIIRRSAQRIHTFSACDICDYPSNEEN
jgi:hypothetical protein